MSNTNIVIEERSRDIGNFLVGRLIPFRKKRMVGPFCFIDHMGPTTLGPKKYIDVGQHPHIGLSTLTYLFEGEIVHSDSTGAHQRIYAGDVGWMSAGKGVVHTERTPTEIRGEKTNIHGFQIWVALPKDMEDIEPRFSYIPKSELPAWTKNDIKFTLIAGNGYGKKSPVPVHSSLYMVQLISETKSSFSIDNEVKGEVGVCVVKGYIETDNEKIEQGNMLVSKVNEVCNIVIGEQSRILLFGGEPFNEERYIDWNFVSSDKEKIKEAKQNWVNKKFKMVSGDSSYIPLPSRKV